MVARTCENTSKSNRLTPQCASRAVGVPDFKGQTVKPVFENKKHSEPHWFIALVANNTEKACAEKLDKMGIETYVISQQYISQWKDGRRKVRERVLTPGKILVRCAEDVRLDIVGMSFISRFMVNKSGTTNEFGRRPIAIVPDKQVSLCRFLLGQKEEEVFFDNTNITRGEKVNVVRGAFKGLEGVVTGKSSDKARVYVNVDFLGCASVLINVSDIERCK